MPRRWMLWCTALPSPWLGPRRVAGVVAASFGGLAGCAGHAGAKRISSPAHCPTHCLVPPPLPGFLQIRVKYASTPATRFRPAAAELQAELGQMLACVRIKQQASMNAFATQLTQITSALGRPSGGKEAACKVAVVEQPPSPTAQLPKLQNALKVGRSAGERFGISICVCKRLPRRVSSV